MNIEEKREVIEYKNCEISYLIKKNEGKVEFTADVSIRFPHDPDKNQAHFLPGSFVSYAQAKEQVLQYAQKCIDDVLFIVQIKPSKPSDKK